MHFKKNIKLFKLCQKLRQKLHHKLRLCCSIIIMIFLIAMSISEVSGKTNNLIYFTDHNLFSEKTSLFSSLEQNIMPGDSYFETLSIENKSNKNIELFFKTENLNNNNLSKNILLKITYKSNNKNIKNILISESNLDMHNKDFISLGEYNSNEIGLLSFELEVPKNLDNNYIDQNLNIDWIFGTVEKDDKTSSESKDEIKKEYDNIQTAINDSEKNSIVTKICFFIFLISFTFVLNVLRKPLLKYHKKSSIHYKDGDSNEKQEN